MKPIPFKLIGLILGCFVVAIVLLILVGVTPVEALKAMVERSMGSARGWTGTLKETTPLLVAGVAVYLGLRAGLFNIGVEGQFIIGACMAAAVATNIGGLIGLILALIVAMIAGALWAFPAGWIKAYRGGHEVVSTIMLNFIAIQVTAYLLLNPLKDQKRDDVSTADIIASSQMGNLVTSQTANGRLQINIAIAIALLLVVFLAWWLKRTVRGYELNAVGANPTAAAVAGIQVKAVTVRAMVTSGAIAGLGGALHVLAYEHRFYSDFSPGYGFNSLGVALLAGASPLALIPSAFLFGILSQSSSALQVLEVPKGMTSILLGLLIIGFAAYRYRDRGTTID